MTRPAELFAAAAIALFAIGLALPRFSTVRSFSISVNVHRIAYAVPLQTVLFGCAALFGVFAFIYSLWMVRITPSAGIWHFWLSTVSILLFGVGFVVIATLPKPAPASVGGARTAAMWGSVLALPVFLLAQVVFLTSLILGIIRGNHTG